MAIAPCAPQYRPKRRAAIGDTLDFLAEFDDIVRTLGLDDTFESNAMAHVATVERLIAQASPDAWEAITWYLDAHAWIVGMATEYGRPVAMVAAVTAVLSPRCSWGENKRRVRVVLDNPTNAEPWTATLDIERKLWRLLTGDDPLDVLGGRKVRSFYNNLLHPDRAGAVTVDRHAVRVVLGDMPDKVGAKILERIGAYQYIAAVYRTAARRLGILPHEAQAIAWMAWREIHAKAWVATDDELDELVAHLI